MNAVWRINGTSSQGISCIVMHNDNHTDITITHTRTQIGIIGGTGLDDPDIFTEREEVTVDTRYGKVTSLHRLLLDWTHTLIFTLQPSDVLINGKIDGIACVLLARY